MWSLSYSSVNIAKQTAITPARRVENEPGLPPGRAGGTGRDEAGKSSLLRPGPALGVLLS